MGTNYGGGGGVNFGRRSPQIGGQFSTLNNTRWRRLVRDHEKRIDVCEAMIHVATLEAIAAGHQNNCIDELLPWSFDSLSSRHIRCAVGSAYQECRPEGRL